MCFWKNVYILGEHSMVFSLLSLNQIHSFTSFCFIVNFEQISFIVFTVHFEKIHTLFSCLYCYPSINTTNCHSVFIGFYFDQVAHIVLICLLRTNSTHCYSVFIVVFEQFLHIALVGLLSILSDFQTPIINFTVDQSTRKVSQHM